MGNIFLPFSDYLGFPVALAIKKLPANAGDTRHTGSIPGSGWSIRGGHDNPFQYSCLENPLDRGAWWAMTADMTLKDACSLEGKLWQT